MAGQEKKGGRKASVSLHDGHRARLKQRFIEHGLDSFNDINVLELLLFYSIPRQDTNPLAHRLLEHFGSLHAVFEADISELLEVEGVGENTAVLLKLIPEASRRYYLSLNSLKQNTLVNATVAGNYLVSMYMYETVEIACVICLDSLCHIISIDEISRGDQESTEISIRKIATIALKNKASRVILAHNHVKSRLEPSNEDIETTRRVEAALKCLQIELVDHIIVMGNRYISMRKFHKLGPDTWDFR